MLTVTRLADHPTKTVPASITLTQATIMELPDRIKRAGRPLTSVDPVKRELSI